MLSLITGGVGKYVAYGALAVSLFGAAAYAKHEYDAMITAQVTAQIAAKTAAEVLATERADNARLTSALAERDAKAVAQAAAAATLKGNIANAKPSSFSCIRSDAGRITLGGLRSNASAGGH